MSSGMSTLGKKRGSFVAKFGTRGKKGAKHGQLDWWMLVDTFFAERIKEWGNKMNANLWKS